MNCANKANTKQANCFATSRNGQRHHEGDRERHHEDNRERHHKDDRERHHEGDRERHHEGDRERHHTENAITRTTAKRHHEGQPRSAITRENDRERHHEGDRERHHEGDNERPSRGRQRAPPRGRASSLSPAAWGTPLAHRATPAAPRRSTAPAARTKTTTAISQERQVVLLLLYSYLVSRGGLQGPPFFSGNPTGGTDHHKKGRAICSPFRNSGFQGSLGHDAVDRLGSLHSDQLLVQSAIEIAQVVGIEPHPIENGGMHVPDVKGLTHGRSA